MAHEQQFRGFLKLFSDTTVFNAASKESPAEQDMLEFIQCHGSKDGMCLKIPSLCSSVDPSSLDNSEPEASYPAAVLKSALKTGHPLRAARGKQDRSHRAQTNTATVEVGDNDSIEASTDLKAVDKKTKAEKIQGNIARTLKYYSRPCPASDQPNMSGALQNLHSNLDKTVKSLVKEQVVALTSKLVRKNFLLEKGTISHESARALSVSATCKSHYFTEIADEKTVSEALSNWEPSSSKRSSMSPADKRQIASESLRKKLKKEKDSSLTSSEQMFSTEEEDQRIVAESLGIVKTLYASPQGTRGEGEKSKNTNGKSNDARASRELGERVNNVESNFDTTKTSNDKTIKSEDNGRIAEPRENAHSVKNDDRHLDILGHIAKVTGIHASSPSLKALISSKQIEKSPRQIQISVTKCSTSFHLLPQTKYAEQQESKGDDTSDNTKKVVFPLLLEGKLCLELFQTEYEVDVETSGTITGIFDGEETEAKLTEMEISLNTKALFQCLIRQINQTIKRFAIKQKSLMAGKEPKVGSRRASRRSGIRVVDTRDDHLKAAQALSELESTGAAKARASNSKSPDRTNKRERDAMDFAEKEEHLRKRRGLMSSFGTEDANIRMTDEGISRHSIGNTNMDALYRQHNGGMADLDIAMRGRSTGAMSAELESLKFLHGNGGLHPILRRSNVGNSGMASAADAVRIAEAENNLHSLSGMHHIGANAQRSEIDAAINSIARRTSYNNGSLSLTPDAMRMAERSDLDAAINSIARRTSYNNGSLSLTPDAMRMAERSDLDAAINNIARRTSYNNGSLSLTPDTMRMAEIEASLNNFAGRSSFNTGSFNAAAEVVRRVEMESVLRHNSRAGDSMRTAADAVRLAELESAMTRRSRTESMAAAADAVRLSEMESAMNHTGASRAGDSMTAAAEAVRRAEMESAMIRGSRPGDSISASDTGRRGGIEAERRRRSSLTEAMKLVEMDALRRSSTGISMAAAAEAVRLAEMEAYGHQRRQSYAVTESSLNNSESVDSLSALMRRSSGPGGSMAAAAEAVRLAELDQVLGRERWNRRRSSGPGNHMAAAAEAVRLADMENELSRQIGGYGLASDVASTQQMKSPLTRNNGGRRVSFTSDLMRDQLGTRFQRT